MIERLYEVIDQVRREFAPDPRTTVYEVAVEQRDGRLILYGATSVPAAAEALHQRIGALEARASIEDALLRLPASGDVRPVHAIVTAPIAPMLAGPLISESHLSQIPMGQRLLVLREHGRWLQCRAPDGYIGWLHRGYVIQQEESEARQWEVGAEAPLHLVFEAEVRQADGSPLARLPWGARIAVREGIATLPDGRRGELLGQTTPFARLRVDFPPDPLAIVETAFRWVGSAYLWGGTTPWGVDCSGLVQTVFRTHGIELPRDSDQQAEVGERVDAGEELARVQVGDLLFFAERENRISHVAISLGGTRIIHSSVGNGGVRANDLAGETGYEQELRKLLVTVRRVVSPES
jgi:gamma-D-glutamyl-L-lysine dipeptidyl-peptidase